MASKKPLVLDANGDLQQIQAGDAVGIAQGGTGANDAPTALTNLGAASAANLAAEITRSTSAEAVLTTSINAAQTAANNAATAAAAAQATANAAVPQTITVNGHALNANVVVTKGDVGLGNVDNTSDVNKPVSTLQAAADAATLATAQAYADGLVVGLWDDRGTFNASVNTYPTTGGSGPAGAIKKGDIWTIGTAATAGPLLGIPVGSNVRATTDAPGQTAGNWSVTEVGLGYVPYNATNPAGYISANQNITVNGDATGSGTTNIALTVSKINGQSLAALATGILKNTTGTGVPSIAVAADFPVLNQNTTGKAATAGLADNVTTNANMTGDVTSVGNVTTLTKVINGVTLSNNEAGAVVPGVPVYINANGTFKKAKADVAATASAIGLTNAGIASATPGIVKLDDSLVLTTAQWDAVTGQAGGLTPGATYFVSNATAGLLTAVVPTTGYLVPVGKALSTTMMSICIGSKIQL